MTLSHRLEMLLSLSLFLSLVPGLRPILFPIQIFTTWVHECGHAMAALVLGGTSIQLTLSKDGSGLTRYKISASRFKRSLVASAGYLGASFFGSLLFALTIVAARGLNGVSIRHLLIGLCILMGLSILVWIRNFFGILSVLILIAVLLSLLYSPLIRFSEEALLFLSIQTALNALFDIRTLFSLRNSGSGTSDAHTLQNLFYLPAWFWAALWLFLSIWMMSFTWVHLKLPTVVSERAGQRSYNS